MPWTLVYLPSEQKHLDADVEMLRASPDVDSVRVFHPSSLEDVPAIEQHVLVHFQDELQRTDDLELIKLHEARRLGGPLPRAWVPGVGPAPLTDVDKAALIERALSSAEGRSRLAMAMASPLRRNLNYANIARRTLMVDPLPQGALPSYDRDIGVAGLIMSNDQVGDATGHAMPGAFGALTQGGTGATLMQGRPGGALITGLYGMTHATDVGNYLQLEGSPHPSNNGTWRIVEVVNNGSVWIEHSNPVADSQPNMNWREFYPPSALGGLDQFTTVIDFPVGATGGSPGPAPGLNVYSQITGYSLDPAPTENPREILRRALLNARNLRPDDAALDAAISDFEALHGRPITTADVASEIAADFEVMHAHRREPGWNRLLDDSFLDDD